jgi:hypothetical protein
MSCAGAREMGSGGGAGFVKQQRRASERTWDKLSQNASEFTFSNDNNNNKNNNNNNDNNNNNNNYNNNNNK